MSSSAQTRRRKLNIKVQFLTEIEEIWGRKAVSINAR